MRIHQSGLEVLEEPPFGGEYILGRRTYKVSLIHRDGTLIYPPPALHPNI